MHSVASNLQDGMCSSPIRLHSFGAEQKPSIDVVMLTSASSMQPWLAKIVEKLPEDKQTEFKSKAQPGIKYLLSKIKDLQL